MRSRSSERRATDHQRAAHHHRRRSRKLDRPRQNESSTSYSPWLDTVRRHGRPITAAFAGAPNELPCSAPPLRNAAVVGLRVTTTIAAATQATCATTARSSSSDSHALNVGCATGSRRDNGSAASQARVGSRLPFCSAPACRPVRPGRPTSSLLMPTAAPARCARPHQFQQRRQQQHHHQQRRRHHHADQRRPIIAERDHRRQQHTLSGGTFAAVHQRLLGHDQTAVTVSIADLTITNTRASGGSPPTAAATRRAGRRLFVASQASVTVSNVTLDTNNATGGSARANTFRNGGGGGVNW